MFNPSVSFDEVKEMVLQSTAYKRFSELIGYTFRDESLFFTALIHRSFAHEVRFECEHNEKLEFLGDSVLGLVVSQKLYELYPTFKEGKLSMLRSSIVNETSLYQLALALKLDQLILLGKGEYKEEGYLKPSLLSNLFEAIIGAIFLDSSFEAAKNILEKIFVIYQQEYGKDIFSIKNSTEFDAKSRLQELCLKRFKTLPIYETVEVEKNKISQFEITLSVQGKSLAKIQDVSKKKGMQKLAKIVLDQKLYELKE